MKRLNSFLGGFFAVLILSALTQTAIVLAFVLNPALFYFRPWEYIKEYAEKTAADDSRWQAPAPGDLSRQNFFLYQDAVDLTVTTDVQGFRSVPSMPGKFLVAVSGDSNIFGSRLSDEDTFPWRLQGLSKLKIFNAGRAPILSALSRPELSGVRLVIDGMAGRSVPHYYQLRDKTLQPYRPLAWQKRDKFDVLTEVDSSRYVLPQLINRTVKRITKDVADLANGGEKPYLFLPHKQRLRNIPLAVDVIDQRRKIFNELGYQYMVMIVPAKQTIYDLDVDRESREFGGRLVKALDKHGIVALDLYTAFEQRKAEGLYHPYDTHWNAKGSDIAAQLALEKIAAQFPQVLAQGSQSLR